MHAAPKMTQKNKLSEYRFDTKDEYVAAIRSMSWDIRMATHKQDWEEVRTLFAEMDALQAEFDKQFPNDKSEK